MSAPTAGTAARGGLVHHLVMYSTPDELVANLLPFVEEGLSSRNSVMTITSPANVRAIRSGLGPRAADIRFTKSRAWYATPAEVIGRYMTYLREQLAQGRPSAYVVAEVPWPRDDERLDREWERYETVINRILAEAPVNFVCLYSTRRHRPSIIEAALAEHPTVMTADGVTASPTYVPPEELLHRMTPELAVPGGPGRHFGPEDRVLAAGYAADQASHSGFDENETSKIAAATIEVLGHGLFHRTPVTVAAWTEGERFVWQIEQEGGDQIAPWIGYGALSPDDSDGWGPWLARHLTDTLEIGRGVTGPAVQLTVRRDRIAVVP